MTATRDHGKVTRNPRGRDMPLNAYITEMRIAKFSEVTIHDRVEVLTRLQRHMERPLLDATSDELRAFQATYKHLAPASVDIYTRHVRAFYKWALGRGLVQRDPAAELVLPRVPKGRPHPASEDDLRTIFSCTDGALRVCYVLAAFAGLRRGEIVRLQRHDLDLGDPSTAYIHGKGRRQRTVPLIGPVVDELHAYGLPRAGWVVTRDGKPYDPERLSIDSHYHLLELGVHTTLHSMRHTFATQAIRATRDPLFVRDLLGHESVGTTEIYMDSNLVDAHARLAPMTRTSERVLSGRPRLSIVQHS